MTIAVTGATGHLGQLVIADLLERSVPAGDIVAIVRDADKASSLGERGVQVRVASYDDSAALVTALAGVDKLLLISGSEVGQRVPQHTNVVNAAKEAGVGSIVYTSALKTGNTTLKMAAEHEATEAVIKDSGLPWTFLRNGWYTENWTGQIAQTLANGAFIGAGGDATIDTAARADYAAAAAVVLTSDGHANTAYELAGDQGWKLADLAEEITRQSGKTVAYNDLSLEDYAEALKGFGLPAPAAEAIADADDAIKRGELSDDSHTLSKLIGRPTTTMAESVSLALK